MSTSGATLIHPLEVAMKRAPLAIPLIAAGLAACADSPTRPAIAPSSPAGDVSAGAFNLQAGLALDCVFNENGVDSSGENRCRTLLPDDASGKMSDTMHAGTFRPSYTARNHARNMTW